MSKKTLVFGASLKPSRYSNFAIARLLAHDYEVVAYGMKQGRVSSVEIDDELIAYKNIHTVTLYLNPSRQVAYYEYLVALNPNRVIFNPGTENPEFYQILEANNIAYEVACTLVLLTTNQY
ncbi:CoA-binding protein [Mangrovimonas sp. TPBH4]|uniref:CoA-binding protein n=1 Tax=Mangrovimonas sp. TPBH4 TaxID=1645914 RepID=UPI0006B56E61|nr:CoA-binding protein [Mangrovimonas sp. TPBH4]